MQSLFMLRVRIASAAHHVFNRLMQTTLRTAALAVAFTLTGLAASSAQTPVTHSFLACGGQTRIVDGTGKTIWSYPHSTRDGWVLPSGNLLLTLSKSKDYPGGGVVEITRDGKKLFEWQGTQAEVNTAQVVEGDRIMVTEAGPKPRLLELDRTGKIVVDVPLTCQLTNHHMQSRMARKLANGNYLVPQLHDKVVREYTPKGEVVWEVKTPNWPFTAIRLANGNTLINCTYGHVSIEVDKAGKTVWQVDNSSFDKPLIKDACGGQRLPNGNTVIAGYGIGADRTKMIEVTPDKKVVWTFVEKDGPGVHHFQILDTNGKPLEGPVLK